MSELSARRHYFSEISVGSLDLDVPLATGPGAPTFWPATTPACSALPSEADGGDLSARNQSTASR